MLLYSLKVGLKLRQNITKINCLSIQNGKTPLHESLAHVHTDVMAFLLKCGADPNIQPKVLCIFLLQNHTFCIILNVLIVNIT